MKGAAVSHVDLNLNERAWQLASALIARSAELRLAVSSVPCGARIVDCGAKAEGGLEAGRQLAEICLAGLGSAQIVRGRETLWAGPAVNIVTDQPLAACMASQYAGWQITGENNYFAMGSGPMRAAAAREPLYEEIGYRERPVYAVGVLETSKLPPDDVCAKIAEQCGVEPANVMLLVARTMSLAGCVQVVARSVETTLHKLHTLGFDLTTIVSGFGTAPLPPPAADDMTAIGRTNDAVLYGGEVTLWVRGDDAALADIGPKTPSCSSAAFGETFATIFKAAGYDFYKIDASLFSPAAVTLVNLTSGRTHRFGQVRADILQRSFNA